MNLREIANGLMYILSTGCQWRAIPKDLPPRSTLYDYFDLWSLSPQKWALPQASITTVLGGCSAMNFGNCFRESFLLYSRWPDIDAPWT